MKVTATAAILVLTGATAVAQVRFEKWTETATLRAPATACKGLRALTTYGFSVDTALVMPPRGAAPEYCHVTGQILPEIRFNVSLPAKWNGRLYMLGNGGFAGENIESAGRVRLREAALAAGFAVTNTDTGHNGARESLASFALNPQKLIDYAYRAVHMTAVTAKAIARTYYGSPVARSYFDGCSTGGRQGLIAAQRFPDDFDGIAVGAPVLDFTGTMEHYALVQQAVQKAPKLIDKFTVVGRRLYEKCDATDGLKDGVIRDPRQCAFDVTADVPTCTTTTTEDCLTAEEAAVFKTLYSPVIANGTAVFPGFAPGPEIAENAGAQPGWIPWLVAREGQSFAGSFVESFFRFMISPGRENDWRTFDAAKDHARMQAIGTLLNASDADLSAFRARGGKILMYYGWADPALSPLMGLKYFEQVAETMKTTDDFFRLFMMPGVFHCVGGPGPDTIDPLPPLVAWVERGAAPQQIVVEKRAKDKILRSRPLCPHPQVAVYKGSGSIDDAASFSCAVPGSEQKLTK
jgi:tannase/feruloyl esterase